MLPDSSYNLLTDSSYATRSETSHMMRVRGWTLLSESKNGQCHGLLVLVQWKARLMNFIQVSPSMSAGLVI